MTDETKCPLCGEELEIYRKGRYLSCCNAGCLMGVLKTTPNWWKLFNSQISAIKAEAYKRGVEDELKNQVEFKKKVMEYVEKVRIESYAKGVSDGVKSKIVEQRKDEIEKARVEGYNQGFSEGELVGKTEERKRILVIVERLKVKKQKYHEDIGWNEALDKLKKELEG